MITCHSLKDPSFNCQIIHTLHERMRTVLCSVYLSAMWNRAKRRRTIESFLLSFDSRSYSLLFKLPNDVYLQSFVQNLETQQICFFAFLFVLHDLSSVCLVAGTLHASPSATPITAPLLSTISPKNSQWGQKHGFLRVCNWFFKTTKSEQNIV